MGTYAINGTPLLQEPTKSTWTDRQSLGLDGNNQIIYAPIYNFEMRWDALTMTQFMQLRDFWLAATEGAGVVTATLPPFSGVDFDTFETYIAVPDEPTYQAFDNRFRSGVAWRLRNIPFTS